MTIIILDIDDTLTQGAGAPPQNDAEWNAMFQTAAPNDVLISQFKQKRTLSDIVIVCTGRKKKTVSLLKSGYSTSVSVTIFCLCVMITIIKWQSM